jgi:D-proline reductase (dithiol) PrdB
VLDHQTVGLAARVIEEMGIPTIYVGVARDIMLQVKPPRAVFLDFPFGHSTGKPFDRELQMSIIKDAFNALKTNKEPGTLIDLPYKWDNKADFLLTTGFPIFPT